MNLEDHNKENSTSVKQAKQEFGFNFEVKRKRRPDDNVDLATTTGNTENLANAANKRVKLNPAQDTTGNSIPNLADSQPQKYVALTDTNFSTASFFKDHNGYTVAGQDTNQSNKPEQNQPQNQPLLPINSLNLVNGLSPINNQQNSGAKAKIENPPKRKSNSLCNLGMPLDFEYFIKTHQNNLNLKKRKSHLNVAGKAFPKDPLTRELNMESPLDIYQKFIQDNRNKRIHFPTIPKEI